MKHLKMIVLLSVPSFPDISINFEQYFKILKLIKLHNLQFQLISYVMAVTSLEKGSLSVVFTMTVTGLPTQSLGSQRRFWDTKFVFCTLDFFEIVEHKETASLTLSNHHFSKKVFGQMTFRSNCHFSEKALGHMNFQSNDLSVK
jgi:hypothetical protein